LKFYSRFLWVHLPLPIFGGPRLSGAADDAAGFLELEKADGVGRRDCEPLWVDGFAESGGGAMTLSGLRSLQLPLPAFQELEDCGGAVSVGLAVAAAFAANFASTSACFCL
jgi:hypothetical protein